MKKSPEAFTPSESASIYREAARLMEIKAPDVNGGGTIDFACHALEHVDPNGYHALCLRMFDVFSNDGHHRDAWLANICCFDDVPDDPEENSEERDRPGRVLALCLMAAMVEAGDA